MKQQKCASVWVQDQVCSKSRPGLLIVFDDVLSRSELVTCGCPAFDILNVLPISLRDASNFDSIIDSVVIIGIESKIN